MSTPSFALPYISGAQSLKTTLLRISCHQSSDLVSTSDGHLPGMWKTGTKQKLLFCWQQLMNTWALADSKFCSVLWHTNTISCLGSLRAYDHWQQYPAVPSPDYLKARGKPDSYWQRSLPMLLLPSVTAEALNYLY